MKKYGVIMGGNFLTVIADKAYSITSSDGRYQKAVDFIKNKKWNEFFLLMNKPALIAKYSNGNVSVFNDEVHYKGKPVHGVVTERILKFMEDGFDFKPLVAFLDNLYENVDENVRQKLYLFLENNKLAITESGSFLAFKLVKDDGTPIYHSGSFYDDNGNQVDRYKVAGTYTYPRDRIVKTTGECSTEGLYVGNKAYWNGAFDEAENYKGGGKMLIVEVFPQDVCNIPHADATKIVVCKLNVLDEYATVKEEVNKSVYGNVEKNSNWFANESLVDGIGDDFVVGNMRSTSVYHRDSNGRFAKKNALLRDKKGRFAKTMIKNQKRDSKGRFKKGR